MVQQHLIESQASEVCGEKFQGEVDGFMNTYSVVLYTHPYCAFPSHEPTLKFKDCFLNLSSKLSPLSLKMQGQAA